jgi:hypothetical protein
VGDIIINNESQLDAYIEHLRVKLAKDKAIKVSVKSAKVRTLTQNSSIHKYCAMLAKAFNDAGLDMETVLAPGTKIPWSEDTVKNLIWRKVQIHLTGKESTKDLLTHEVSQVYEVVNRHLSQTFGVFVPFPSRGNHGG